MKKLLTITAVGAILTAPASAVQKCVALDASTTRCTSTPTAGKADWSMTCSTNGTIVPIKGIVMCSNQAGDAEYDTSDTITTLSNPTDTTNEYCWCKMVEPAVSSWVFVNLYSSAGNCAVGCSEYCTTLALSNSAFRSVLFGSLAN